MSLNIGIIPDAVQVIQFYGGDKRGVCIQITDIHEETRYVQLTLPQAKELFTLLKGYFNWERSFEES